MQKEVFFLDSNIWISYVITRRLNTLVALIHNSQLTVLTSLHLVEEIQEVLHRSKFKKYLKHSDIKEVIMLHVKLCQLVETDETSHQLSDAKDNFLLNLYNKGKATVLVSGDKELLHEANALNYRVMTLREFELLTQPSD
jgi:putative PIN family toxin of toxin-antitoxin system